MSVKNNQTIAEKISVLDTLVAWFDSDEFELEKAFDQYKKAEALALEIEKQLDTMKNEVVVLKQRFDES